MRKVNIKIKVGRAPLTKEHIISAYLTPVAGLVIHPEVEYDTHDDRFIMKRNSWAITQYPTGQLAFKGIPTKDEALMIVNKDMACLNWVGLNAEEAMAVNDPKELQELTRRVNEEIHISQHLHLTGKLRK